MSTYFLNADELAATQAKVDKVNQRAAQRGFTGRFELTAKKGTRTVTTPSGSQRTMHGFEVELTGEAPSYEGWRFVAAVDATDSGTPVLRYAPGAEPVNNDDFDAGECEHCKTKRNRKHTYLVLNEDSGTMMQVGKTCMKDFLGWSVWPVFMDVDAVSDNVFDGFSGGMGLPDFDTIEVAQLAFACARVWGYQNSYAKNPTREAVALVLVGAKDHDKIVAAIADDTPTRDETIAMLDEVRETLTEPGFEQNLKAVLDSESVSRKHLGIAVSVASVHERMKTKQAEKKAREAQYQSQWLGTIGNKLTVTGTVTAARAVETMYGTTTLIVVSAGDGDVVKMFTSARWSHDTETGDVVTIEATVKDHDTFNDRNETVVNRPKLIERKSA